MTTIATDGHSMAADSLATSGDLTIGLDVVKIFRYAGAIYGACGLLDDLVKFKRLLEDGDVDIELSDVFSVIRLSDRGVHFTDKDLIWHKGAKLHAIGSGREIALGAMHAGATPTEALYIAKKLNINTGGKIRTLYLNE